MSLTLFTYFAWHTNYWNCRRSCLGSGTPSYIIFCHSYLTHSSPGLPYPITVYHTQYPILSYSTLPHYTIFTLPNLTLPYLPNATYLAVPYHNLSNPPTLPCGRNDDRTVPICNHLNKFINIKSQNRYHLHIHSNGINQVEPRLKVETVFHSNVLSGRDNRLRIFTWSGYFSSFYCIG